MSHPATELLTRAEIRRFARRSDLRGALSVGTDWGIIAAALAVAAALPHPIVIVLSMIVIGGRQLGLAVLMHESAHRALFRTRWLNEHVGAWLCAAPSWTCMRRYRRHHVAHHRHTGTDQDPDLGLNEPFPTDAAGMARKLTRDLTGIAGLRRITALLAMDLGFITYTASVGAQRVRDPEVRRELRAAALPSLARFAILQAALAGTLTLLGHAWLIALWWGAWLVPYGVFLRIRAIAEHACTDDGDDRLRNTRTTDANPLARLLVAPHHVNYHLEHHLLMGAPHWQLPHIRRRLGELGLLTPFNHATGYRQVLRLATAAPAAPAAAAPTG